MTGKRDEALIDTLVDTYSKPQARQKLVDEFQAGNLAEKVRAIRDRLDNTEARLIDNGLWVMLTPREATAPQRAVAALCLGWLRFRSADAGLLRVASNDPDPAVREAAQQALHELTRS